MNRLTPAVIGFALLLAACSAGVGPGASPSTPPSDGIEHPTSGDEPIVIIETRGGFVPVEFMVSQLPPFVLLGDGRVIVQGAQTLEFPGPALPPLMERTLTEEGIQQVLRALADTDIFEGDLELRGAQNFVADASDTVFTVNAGGDEITVSVYGLGALMPGQDAPEGISSAELEAHAVLQQVNEQLMALDTWLPADAWEDEGWQPYEPEALRLYVRDVSGQPVEGGELPQQQLEWPTETDPAAFGEEQAFFSDGTRCGVVEGDEAATWLEALGNANQNTLWVPSGDPDARYVVTPRPLLPHEELTCPELAGA
jgi:hypothetical protein